MRAAGPNAAAATAAALRPPRLTFFTSGARGQTAILCPRPGHRAAGQRQAAAGAGGAGSRCPRLRWPSVVLPVHISIYICIYIERDRHIYIYIYFFY